MKKQIDVMLGSNNPWLVLLGCTFGTPALTAVFLGRSLRRDANLDGVTPFVFACILGSAALIGLTVVGFQKYKTMKSNSILPPMILRAVFDGQPLKLLFLVPILIIILLVVAALTA